MIKTYKTKEILCKFFTYVYPELVLMLAGIACGVSLLVLSNTGYNIEEFSMEPFLLFLNIAPVVIFILLLYGLSGKIWIAYSTGSIILLTFSLINYYKLTFRNDPLLYEDILIAREAINMFRKYTLFLDAKIIFCTIIIFISSFGFYIIKTEKIKFGKRILIVFEMVFLCLFLYPLYQNRTLYDSFNNEFWSPTSTYTAHGFIYPFIHSISSAQDTAPVGYDEQETQKMLEEYNDTDIPDNRKINIFAVMREAYVDFSKYNINGLNCNGYELYHSLQNQSYSGELYVNIFAGGTVDTERGFLTGDYCVKNFRKNSNSYIWYLKNQGYVVEGSHPYYQWFYNRENINSYLGFDNYLFYENYYGAMTDSHYPEDKILYSKIYDDFIRNKESGKPYFSFNVNVQSHGPYDITRNNGEKEYLTGEHYSDECRNAMNNYMNVIMDSDTELLNFVDMLQNEEEPVILVLFSDHLPWMGDDMIFYEEMGIDFLQDSDEINKIQYTTEYLIWANDAAKKVLNNKFSGEGPMISPCFLMNLLFEQCSWNGNAFSQAMDEIRNVMPVISTNERYIVDGIFCRTIPEERTDIYNKFLNLQYYWRKEFLY